MSSVGDVYLTINMYSRGQPGEIMPAKTLDAGDVRQPIHVARVAGVAPEIDQLAATLDARYRFLRARWFEAAAPHRSSTLLAMRDDGVILVAIPATAIGPSVVGAQGVPGSYWPFRSALIAPGVAPEDLAEILSHATTHEALGPIWRMGPVYADNPAVQILKSSAAAAGWTVLVRRLGASFHFDTASGWPRKTTRKRLKNYQTQLAERGTVRFEHVRGDGWNARTLNTLAAIENASWISSDTDSSGAKFIAASRRQEWLHILGDPALAESLSATILYVGDRPVAFSFDLTAGSLQYSIASSFDADFGRYRPGKIVTAHQIEIARAQGIKTVDFGAGDSGYKRAMGAAAGPEILDLLMVRSRAIAALISMRWSDAPKTAKGADPQSKAQREAHGSPDKIPLEMILAMGAVAAAALAIVE